jgi:hypothetical protein
LNATVEAGGVVSVSGGANAAGNPFIAMHGTLNVDGSTSGVGTVNSDGKVNAGNGATLNTYHGGDPNLQNDGLITATGGLLSINGPLVTGNGTLLINTGAVLSINGTSSNTVQFNTGAILQLDAAARQTGLITAFGKGDSVDLKNALVTNLTASDQNGVTTVTAFSGGAFVNSFRLAGDYSLNDLALGSDNVGGSLVSYVDHSPAPAPTPAAPAPVVTPTPAPAPTLLLSLSEGRRGDAFVLNSDGTVQFGHGGTTDTLTGVKEIDFIDGREVFDPADHVASVVRLYQAALGRQPDQAGLHFWSTALANGTPLTALADSFLSSQEFTSRFGVGLGSADYVTRLYQNVLGRAPDPSGLAFYQGNLDSGAATRGQTLAAISESPENKAATASTVAAGIWDLDETSAEVARLYDTTLGRLPDASGLAYWSNTIKQGGSVLAVADSFVGSAEFTATYGALDNRSFVNTVYANTLHRAADQGGSDFWVNALAQGSTRAQVIVGFSESAEHQSNTAPNILANAPSDYGIRLA